MAPRIQRPSRCRQPRGMILLVVLLIVSLLALLGASFSHRMNADLAALKAKQDIQQAELAARSGIERVIWVLRDKRTDVEQWYNNPKWFRRIPIWMPGKVGGSESIADQEPVPGVPAWRFSIVSYKIDGDTAKIRYGVTDEAAKINLNTATRMQLIRLFEQVKPEDVTPEALADCLIDWRDKDDTPNSAYGAESSYYNTLEPRYKAKNKPLDTVEELLMIKGFNGRILYGEDYNRNGYLDDNEDDGEEEGAFPPDNGDGILNRGILPFVTIYSWDWNTGNDNARRVNINLENFSKPEELPEYITQELSPQVIEFIAEARKRGYVFKSPAELLGLEVYEDGSTNYDQLWRSFSRTLRRENRVPEEDQVPDEEEESPEGEGDDTEGGGGNQDGGNQDGGDRNGGDQDRDNEDDRRAGDDQRNEPQQDEEARPRGNRRGGRDDADAEGDRQSENDEDGADAQEKRDARRRQSAGIGQEPMEDRLPSQRERRRNAARGGDQEASEGGNTDEDAGEQRGSRRRGSRGREADNEEGENNAEEGSGRGRRGRREGAGEEGSGEGGGRSRGTPIVSPATAADMPAIMDRLTTAMAPAIAGLINVNTAPVEVLSTIPGLPPDKAEAVVAKREQVTGPEKMTTGWLVSTGALDAETFALISNQVTTRSIQFTIDVIGFADHTGAMKRIEAVVEMRGQISQIKYYRDISSLGIGFPIHDDQRSEGFAFSDR